MFDASVLHAHFNVNALPSHIGMSHSARQLISPSDLHSASFIVDELHQLHIAKNINNSLQDALETIGMVSIGKHQLKRHMLTLEVQKLVCGYHAF